MTESVTIKVGGMVCAACQAHVQRALDETHGVSKAAVNLMTGQAQVSFDPAIVEPEKNPNSNSAAFRTPDSSR